jgi:hypothetical protein
METREFRVIQNAELRATGEDSARKITGYSAVFNSPSLPIMERAGSNTFTETIRQGAFSRTIREDDIFRMMSPSFSGAPRLAPWTCSRTTLVCELQFAFRARNWRKTFGKTCESGISLVSPSGSRREKITGVTAATSGNYWTFNSRKFRLWHFRHMRGHRQKRAAPAFPRGARYFVTPGSRRFRTRTATGLGCG